MDNKLLTERIHYYAPAINIVMVVTIGGAPSEVELKAAIHKALGKHEIYNSKVVLNEEGVGYYSVIPEGNVKIEVRDYVDEGDWKKIINEQERIAFDFIHGELIRFFLLRRQDTTQLVIIAHHLAGDGLAITFLIRDIMTALGDPSITYQKLPLRICTEKDIPKAATLKPHVRLLVKLANRQWNKNKKVFQYGEFLSMFHKYWSSRKTAVENKIISGEDFIRLQKICKEKNITINTAIATAFILAIKTEKESGYAVSVRPEGYEGMGNFASGISIEYEPDLNKSFWENAVLIQGELYKRLKQLRKKYFVLKFMSKVEPTIMDAIYFNTFDGYQNKIAESFGSMFRYKGNPRGIGLTNLTRLTIPRAYGRYSIDKLEFVAPIVPNAKRIIGVVTIEDMMSITMNYEDKGNSDDKKKEFEEAMNLLSSLK